MAREAVVLADVAKALGALPFVRLERHNTGAMRDPENPERLIRFGVPGQADLRGRMTMPCGCGRELAIETKGSHGLRCRCKTCRNQRAWGAMVVRMGGIYIRGTDAEMIVGAVLGARSAGCPRT